MFRVFMFFVKKFKEKIVMTFCKYWKMSDWWPFGKQEEQTEKEYTGKK